MADFDRREFLRLAGAAGGAAAVGGCASFGRPGGWLPDYVPYQPLAADPESLRGSYDLVVVGSGYGGAITAARLAKGRRVAVFERGREWAPGDFPETLSSYLGEERRPDKPFGLYEWGRFPEINVLVGSGV